MSKALQDIRILDLTQVRGGHLRHAGACPSRRRRHQGRAAEGRRSRPPRRKGRGGRRLLLLPSAQRQQAVDHPQPEGPAGQGHLSSICSSMPTSSPRTSHRRAGAARTRLRRARQGQPPHRARPRQGLRHLRPLQGLQVVRHHRAGHRRLLLRHRLPRPPADAPRPDARRHGYRHAPRHRHPRRPPPARHNGTRPEGRGRDAGRGRQPLPHLVARLPRDGQERAAHRQRLLRPEHQGDLPVRPRRRRRLHRHHLRRDASDGRHHPPHRRSSRHGQRPRWADRDFRNEHAEEFDAALESWTKQRDKFEAMRILGEAGIPPAPASTPRTSTPTPTCSNGRTIVDMEHPVRGTVPPHRQPHQALRLPNRGAGVAAPGPAQRRGPRRHPRLRRRQSRGVRKRAWCRGVLPFCSGGSV